MPTLEHVCIDGRRVAIQAIRIGGLSRILSVLKGGKVDLSAILTPPESHANKGDYAKSFVNLIVGSTETLLPAFVMETTNLNAEEVDALDIIDTMAIVTKGVEACDFQRTAAAFKELFAKVTSTLATVAAKAA